VFYNNDGLNLPLRKYISRVGRVVDPCSSAIVRIELAESRKVEDWKRHFECLYDNGMEAIYLVCDEGQGIRAGRRGDE
jgi:hypothetical protein